MIEQPGSDFPDRMGLSRADLERVAHRTEQWASMVANRYATESVADDGLAVARREELHREMASLFTIAGSYRLLANTPHAIELMGQAAHHFAAVGSTYAHVLAVCGADRSSEWLQELDDRGPEMSPSDRASVLLRLGWMDAEGDSVAGLRDVLFAHLERAVPQGSSEVGRLRVPLNAIARAVRAVDAMAHDEESVDFVTAAAHDYLTRAHDMTAVAMADTYHWRNLLSSVLPVEPEAAALGALTMAAASKHEAEGVLMERLNLPAEALMPLVVGLAIARSADDRG